MEKAGGGERGITRGLQRAAKSPFLFEGVMRSLSGVFDGVAVSRESLDDGEARGWYQTESEKGECQGSFQQTPYKRDHVRGFATIPWCTKGKVGSIVCRGMVGSPLDRARKRRERR